MSNDQITTEAVVVSDTFELVNSDKNIAYHEKGIREHYCGESMTDLAQNDDVSTEILIKFLVKELCREIDNLAGNRMVALKNGELEKATVI